MNIERIPHVTVVGVLYRGGYPVIGGPPLVEDDRLNGGRPTSVWDLEWTARNELPVPVGMHATSEGQLRATYDWHYSVRQTAGRRPKLALVVLTAIKNRYWYDGVTQPVLAKEYNVNLTTIWRIVHGVTAWYA